LKKKKIFIRLISFIVILIVLFAELPFSFAKTTMNNDFKSIINTSIINDDAKIKDIAMLGAHDAFTHKLNIFSENDENLEPSTTNSFYSYFIRGLITRMSKAQNINSDTMLKAGVRYFDIRATYHHNQWKSTHNFISGALQSYIIPILDFLNENNGEVIILDFQEIALNQNSIVDFINYLSSIKVNDKSIFDYVTYNPTTISISDLDYKTVTNNRTSSGLVILFKNHEQSLTYPFYYNRENTTISTWHNKMSQKEMYDSIEEEYNRINNSPELLNKLRINQAQQTFVISVNMLANWSLLTMANQLNGKYIKNLEQTKKWLSMMPIFMVDYVNSNQNSFNQKINELIISYNSKL
jgi:hypothetical protein